MTRKISLLTTGALSLGLSLACGGGNDAAPVTPVTPPAPVSTSKGYFVDSPVAGLQYVSGGQTGVTSSSGEFVYETGKTVTFSIGGIKLPTVAGGSLITPFSMFGASNYNDTRVINLVRLLQTLDSDQNPSNGISIPSAVLTAAAAVNLTDFADASFDSKVAAVVSASGASQLVDASGALNHLQSHSIAGTWVIGGQFSPDTENGNSTDITQSNGFQVLVFWPNGSYLHGATRTIDAQSKAGIERGTYTWDPATGTTTLVAVTDTNGEWGPGSGTTTLKLESDGNTILVPADGGKVITLKRLQTVASNPIAGTWGVTNPDGFFYVAIVCLPTGEFMFLEDSNQDLEHGTPGIEWGTYTWNVDTGAFNVTFLGDTNGQWGFSDPANHTGYTLTITGSSLAINDGTSATAYRLEP